MTDDEADFKLLSLASDKGKFAIPVALLEDGPTAEAMERGFDHEWFRLIDVTPLAFNNPLRPRDAVYRIFKLTEAGVARLTELAKTRQTS